MNSPRWIARMIYCACIESCILGLKEVYSSCYFLQNSSWHESWIIKIWISKESINFINMKRFGGFCITKDLHSINLSQTHCRYRQGYKQAKTQLIVKWARGPACWILTQWWKKIFQNESQPHCRYWQGYKQAKIQVIVKWTRGPACWILTQSDGKKKFQNESQPHCRYRQGYKQAKSHSLTTEQGV
jgi:hypothetical protein